MKTQNKKNTVFDITLNENLSRVNQLSGNRVPWHLKAVSHVEKWVLKHLYNLNPESDRIVRFYTYNLQGTTTFDFKCPNYNYDTISCIYDDFIKVSHEIGTKICEIYGISGNYFYDVKISLIYEKHEKFGWTANYHWEILRTNNPRCVQGNPKDRKDCSYLVNKNSKLTIDGYTLNGIYKEFVDVLNDLVNKTIIVHSKSDAKSLLRVMKFLGVKSVVIGNKRYYNNPNTRGWFSKYTFGYRVGVEDGRTTLYAIRKRDLPTDTRNLLDIDEFIVKRSFRAIMRDRRRLLIGR